MRNLPQKRIDEYKELSKRECDVKYTDEEGKMKRVDELDSIESKLKTELFQLVNSVLH